MNNLRICASVILRTTVPTLPTRCLPSLVTLFHTSSTNHKFNKLTGEVAVPTGWTKKNDIIYPPTEIGQEKRPAWVCHMRAQIRYSAKKMYYVAILVRGLSIDEAFKQLSFLPDKGAAIAKEVLEEAQELAVKEHNVEYKSNLWIADSFVGKGHIIKGLRRHARARWGEIRYKYCHYFVRLEEGPPPKHYYRNPEKTGHEKLEDWLNSRRDRDLMNTP